MSTRRHVIVDIDGTIADLSHRMHHIQGKGRRKDWTAFFAACGEDVPHDDIIRLLQAIAASTPQVVFHYVSGRSDGCRSQTEAWLQRHGLPRGALLMRRAGDFRTDDVVKEEILDTRLELSPADVWFVLDDRDRVVDMWRRRGFRVLQVAEGAF